MTTTDCDFQVIITEELTELVIEKPVISFLEVEATGLPGVDGKDAVAFTPLPFYRMGPLAVRIGQQKFYVEYDGLALGIRASLVTPAVGDDAIVTLRHNGAVLANVTIPEGAETSGYVLLGGAPSVIAAGDYFTIDVDQIGTSEAGETLTVTLWMRVETP